MSGEEFRRLGYQLVDRIAGFLDSLPSRPVTTGETPEEIRSHLGDGPLPDAGAPADALLTQATDLLFDHSLLNGHPRFMGYITSSAAPIGALADLLAATVNPNGGGWNLSPMASEIEAQAVRWLADLVGFPAESGLLVSGGNMANFVGFLAARRAGKGAGRPLVYASRETHTWVQKAADLFGLGSEAIRWVETGDDQRLRPDLLNQMIAGDQKAGHRPLMVIGTAGTVATGAIDPLPEIADICKRHQIWFHVDGAYGALAAALPEAPLDLKGLAAADSLALDPHKWLYAPLEAGCTLVRKRQHLLDAFSYRPSYYNFDADIGEPPTNYYELGPQNSRGFRALKVWLGLRRAGRRGIIQMIRDDMEMARYLAQLVEAHAELAAHDQHLSITTFRFEPADLAMDPPAAQTYLNELNQELLNRLQAGGEAYISNAVIHEQFLLRACVVNFRTGRRDMEALVEIVVRYGRELDAKMRPRREKR
jgi:glutamate/tyrosine decarboxylase-like PLP-dependent enzyme